MTTKSLSLTEYVILGSVMSGEMHGYEIMQFLGSALEAALRLSTSQLYVLLKKLEQEGLLDARAENQVSRPSKRVFDLTIEGRKRFLDWVGSPVEHVRDFRMEFLCKMFFFDHLSLSGANGLVAKQIRVLEDLLAKIQGKTHKDEDRFMELAYGFKASNVACLISWLKQEALPFAEHKGIRKKKTSSKSKDNKSHQGRAT
jgi:DNA-binding PadR family transcriptional regulator